MKIFGYIKRTVITAFLYIMVWSCSTNEQLSTVELKNRKISLEAEINQVSVTRVNDNGFCDGDAMAVYIVDYEGTTAGTLKNSGNRANNLKHTYNESQNKWTSSYDVYFKDNNTPVDIYGYYPAGSPDDVNKYDFTVQQNQSTSGGNGVIGGYEASDFLWGKVSNISPTENRITLPFYHRMSSANVELLEGDGFAEDEWNNLAKYVVIKNVKRKSLIDLSTGVVTPEGDVFEEGTVPYRKESTFRAIVVPQIISSGKELFSITVGTVPYTFSKSENFEYISGKMHKFTIRVDKKSVTGEFAFTLVSESITAWENDAVSHDATMREYIVVNSASGALKDSIKVLGKDYRKLQSLKITGRINNDDFYFMRDSMKSLTYLNLKEVDIVKTDYAVSPNWNVREITYSNVRCIPDGAFNNGYQKSSLRRIVFPDSLDIIGSSAFLEASLTGTLIIPEGVRCIGLCAFEQCKMLNGKLILPSSLEIISGSAFAHSSITGELNLPHNLEYIGSYAFVNCADLIGTLRLPDNLEVIERSAFSNCGFSGDLKIPDKVTSIEQAAFSCTNYGGMLILPDNLQSVGSSAFWNCQFIGPLVLPSTVVNIESEAFYANNFIGDLVLPEGLLSLGASAFAMNVNLSGIITIPAGIETIPANLFSFCSQINGIKLYDGINYIGKNAFAYCYQLGSIVSMAQIPPEVMAGVFDGVPKDNFTLEVPESSLSAYKAAVGWSDFKRISAHHELVCRPSQAVALNNRCTKTLVLDAEGDWEVESIPDWCSLSQTSGGKKTELILTISELPAGSEPRSGEIVFKLKDKDYTHSCNVSQYNYNYKENEVITLQRASKGNNGGINLVFLGDGYDGKDISEGKYLSDIQEQVNNFFDIHPYKAYKEYFNVYTSIAISQESGIGTVNTIKYNKFETTYTGGVGLKCNNEAVFSYVLDMNTTVTESNLGETLIVLVPNATDYGGICYMWSDGSAISICPKSSLPYPYDTRGVLQHEACGHGFGKLGDEYIYHNAFIDACICGCCLHADEIRLYKLLGWYDNLSLSGKMHEVPWSHLIFDSRYSDIVDIYEGAAGHTRGVYRSEYASCMNNNISYLSTISRESIVKRIKRYAGENYSFEEFVSKDSRDVGTVTKSADAFSSTLLSPRQSHSAPVILSGSPLQNKKR